MFDNSSKPFQMFLVVSIFSGKTRVMQTLFCVIDFYPELKALMKNNLAKYPQTLSPLVSKYR